MDGVHGDVIAYVYRKSGIKVRLYAGGIDSLIPELGLKLAGAVCDFTEPATGQNKLFFPVE
jgi:hypothetical protein